MDKYEWIELYIYSAWYRRIDTGNDTGKFVNFIDSCIIKPDSSLIRLLCTGKYTCTFKVGIAEQLE